ncbi:MAG: hypothetical protein DWH81_15505 [Planctomycetota bacterium]|nr:MAG: hypothetical protein DWH81_15505 [Planctomycetota bacterium]
MLLPSSRFDLPFTCIDSTGLPTAPTGTPTGTLVKNGVDQGTTVTVSMTGAQGIASCSIPSNAAAGDRFYLRISAVISAITYVVAGPSEAIESPHTLTTDYDPAKSPAPTAATIATAVRTELVTELAHIDATISSRLAAASYSAPTVPPSPATIASQVRTELSAELERVDISVSSRLAANSYSAPGTIPTASAIAAQVRTELSTELARVDAAISSRLAASSYTSPPSINGLATSDSINSLASYVETLPDAAQIAAVILVDPTKKLLTNDEGYVTSTNDGGTGGGGNQSTFIMPLRLTSMERVQANRIDLFVRERVPLTISIYDAQRQAVDCIGLVCTLFIEGGVEIPELTPSSEANVGIANRYSFTPPESLTSAPATRWFSLRVSDTTQRVLAFGHLVIAQVP